MLSVRNLFFLRSPPVHWSLLRSKALALTAGIVVLYLQVKLADTTYISCPKTFLSLSTSCHFLGVLCVMILESNLYTALTRKQPKTLSCITELTHPHKTWLHFHSNAFWMGRPQLLVINT
jgi:hypothetical protein